MNMENGRMNLGCRRWLVALVVATGVFGLAPAGAAQQWRSELRNFDELDARVRMQIEGDLARWWARRERLLNDVTETIDDDREDTTVAAWRSAAAKGRGEAEKMMRKYASRESRGHAFAQVVMSAEVEMFEWIARSPFPGQRDDLWKRRNALEKKTIELDRKWETLTKKDDANDRKQLATIDEVEQIVLKTLEKQANTRGSLKEKLSRAVASLPELPPGVSDPVKWAAQLVAEYLGANGEAAGIAIDILTEAVRLNHATVDAIAYREQQFKTLIQVEKNLIIVLRETRREVESYVNGESVRGTEEVWSDTKAAAKKLADRSDDTDVSAALESFVGATLEVHESLFDEYNRTFVEFTKKHKGKFFGPVSTEIVEELLEEKRMATEAKSLKALDVQKLLLDRYFEGSSVVKEISLGDNPDTLRIRIGRMIAEAAKEWEESYDEVSERHISMQERIDARKDELRGLIAR